RVRAEWLPPALLCRVIKDTVARCLEPLNRAAPLLPLLDPPRPTREDPGSAAPHLPVRATRVLLPHGVLGEGLGHRHGENGQQGLLVHAVGTCEEVADEVDVLFGHGAMLTGWRARAHLRPRWLRAVNNGPSPARAR